MTALSSRWLYVFILFVAMIGLSQLFWYQDSYAVDNTNTTEKVTIEANNSCNGNFLTMPAWYNNISAKGEDGKCYVMSPKDFSGSNGQDQLSGYILRIALNVIEAAIQAVAYLAFFFVLYGGFQYLTSSGNPDQAAKARTTIRNAFIGVVIAFSATAVVNRLSVITTNTGSAQAVIGSILNIVYFAAMAVALIMIIIAGYKFMTGGSSPSSIQNARNTILYSVIGLIIVILAFAITNFVLGQLQ